MASKMKKVLLSLMTNFLNMITNNKATPETVK